MTGDELYRQYLSGDPDAGDRLMLLWGDRITAYLSAILHNMEDAEEQMLDCFAALLVRKPDIREGYLQAYLFRMARYKAIHLQKLRSGHREFSLDENLLGQLESPESIIVQNERSYALHRCLNRIAPQYREALWLVYAMEMSYAQAADVMRCNTRRIHSLLSEGKQRMRKELDKEGISHADI